MKTQKFWKWTLGGWLAVLPLVGGCLQQTSSPPLSTAGLPHEGIAAAPAQAMPSQSGPVQPEAADTNAPAVDIADAPVKAITSETAPPPAVGVTAPVSEIVKLANSGVEESVMLSLVTNSTSTFNLTADQIIYLNDIGVPSAVVTAMIQRDQALRDSAVAQAAAPQVLAPQPAPEPVPQPAPAQVAPQVDYSAGAYAPPPESAPAPVEYSTFYDSLSPYGTWIDVEGYGRCWRPTVVVANPSWQPYLDSGHWVYTDSGWYWLSDYSWGWAPFHYGRWFRHNRIGWCWMPDTVWGPSWVTWRYSDDYCGWAPLPPAACYRPGFGFTYYGRSVALGFDFGLSWNCYSFIGWGDFHHHHLHRYAVPHDRIPHFYNRTVAVTRISGNHNRIVNDGISAQRVAAATHTPVQRVAIREVSNTRSPGAGGRAERLERNGRTLAVYRPPVRATPNPAAERLRTDLSHRPGTSVSSQNQGSTATRSGSAVQAVRPVRSQPQSTPHVANGSGSSVRAGAGAEKPLVINKQPAPVRTSRPNSSANNLMRPSPTPRSPSPTHNSPQLAEQDAKPSVSRAPTYRLDPPKPAPSVQNRSVVSRPAVPTRSTPTYRAPSQPAQTPQRPAYPSQSQRTIPNYQAPSRPAQVPQAAAPVYQAPRVPQSRTYSTPSYSPPVRSAPEVPRYTPAPSARSYAPTPSYSPAPQRSFSAPSPAARAPAMESRPAPSSSARSSAPVSRGSSGGGSRGGRGRNAD